MPRPCAAERHDQCAGKHERHHRFTPFPYFRLVSSGATKVVPRFAHERNSITWIAEAGMKFRSGVSARPRDEFAVNYDCLRPPWLRVKVPPCQMLSARSCGLALLK